MVDKVLRLLFSLWRLGCLGGMYGSCVLLEMKLVWKLILVLDLEWLDEDWLVEVSRFGNIIVDDYVDGWVEDVLGGRC